MNACLIYSVVVTSRECIPICDQNQYILLHINLCNVYNSCSHWGARG